MIRFLLVPTLCVGTHWMAAPAALPAARARCREPEEGTQSVRFMRSHAERGNEGHNEPTKSFFHGVKALSAWRRPDPVPAAAGGQPERGGGQQGQGGRFRGGPRIQGEHRAVVVGAAADGRPVEG